MDLGTRERHFALDDIGDKREVVRVCTIELLGFVQRVQNDVKVGAQNDFFAAAMHEFHQGGCPCVARLVGSLDLLLGSAIAMTEHCDVRLEHPAARFLDRTYILARRAKGASDSVGLAELAQNSSALVIVVVIALDKTPAIDVNDIALLLHTKQVEAANELLKCHGDTACHVALFGGQLSHMPNFFPIRIALHEAVDDG